MKKLFLIWLLLAASYSFGQTCGSIDAVHTTVTFGFPATIPSTTAGNSIVVMVAGVTPTFVHSNAGDVLTQAAAATPTVDGITDMSIWYGATAGGATGLTSDVSGGTTWIYELPAGVELIDAGFKDGVSTAGYGSTTAGIPGPILHGPASNAFYIAMGTDNGGNQLIQSPFTQDFILGHATDGGHLIASGDQQPTFNRAFSSSNWTTSGAVFGFTSGTCEVQSDVYVRGVWVQDASGGDTGGGGGSSPLLITTVSPLPNAAQTAFYSKQLTATGGVDPDTWATGTLPAGLALDADTGIISGVPTTAGTTTFTATVTDSVAATNSKSLSLTVLAGGGSGGGGGGGGNGSAHSVLLKWNASAGAATYNAKRSTTNGGPYTTIASGITGTQYTDQNVNQCTTYFYVVSAVNSGGESPNSAQATASIPCSEDLLNWMLFTNRTTQHLSGTWSYLDGDTTLTASAGPKIWWLKTSGGGPGWDLFNYDSTYIYQKLTENGDEAPTDAHAWKRFVSLPKFAPRNYVLGTTVTFKIPHPNLIQRTVNCELDGETAFDLGDIMMQITTEFSKAWGGDLGTQNTVLVTYYYSGTDPNYNAREEFRLVKGKGRAQWTLADWDGSGWHVDQTVTHNTIVSGSLVEPNFPCGFAGAYWP